MSTYQKIACTFSHDNQLLRLMLNAPKGNVLDKLMMTEIIDALESHGSQPAVKAIVFDAAGDHFSFGASVPEHQKQYVAEMLQTFHRMFRVLIEVSKPTLAVVQGQCLGGGLELAAFCNWIFAAENAAFGQPEINLAVFPPAASLILPHRIGQSAADDVILTGRVIDAATAQQFGLVHSIDEDPAAAALQFLEKYILPKSAAALQFTVRASRFAMYTAINQHIEQLEKLYVDELMSTHDANEGIAAFLEKRSAEWKNR